MNETQPIYLSPAFSNRTDEELRFLSTINGATGFSLFWIDIVKPLLCELNAKHLLEIGAETGEHTWLLLQYCDSYDANLTIIEPVVTPSLQEVVNNSARTFLYAEKSLEALPRVNVPIDVVMLEGDLNYYSVRGDLLGIDELSHRQNIPFPLVLVRSMSWPYARRDMYYDPGNLPKDTMHDHEKSGMTPWTSQLKEMMINYPFENAKHEGEPKNGVWTAVEDFIAGSNLPLKFFLLPSNNGLGVIYLENSKAEQFINQNLVIPEKIRLFLETYEIVRRQQGKLQKRQTQE